MTRKVTNAGGPAEAGARPKPAPGAAEGRAGSEAR